MTVQLSDVAVCFDFDRLTPDGKLFDFGPGGYHATFGAAGAAPVRINGVLTGYYFSGGQYFTLPTTVYNRLPTAAWSWAALHYPNQNVANTAIFGAGALVLGNYYGCNSFVDARTGVGYVYTSQFRGTATAHTARSAAGSIYYGNQNRRITVMTADTTPDLYQDTRPITATWSTGAYGGIVYDTATVPRLGDFAAGGGGYYGIIQYYIALNRVMTADEKVWITTRLRDGERPFSYR